MRKPFEPLQYPLSEIRLSDSVVLIEDANAAIAQDKAVFDIEVREAEQKLANWQASGDRMDGQIDQLRTELSTLKVECEKLKEDSELSAHIIKNLLEYGSPYPNSALQIEQLTSDLADADRVSELVKERWAEASVLLGEAGRVIEYYSTVDYGCIDYPECHCAGDHDSGYKAKEYLKNIRR